MPKRVLDGDAMWASSKLSQCREQFIPEYAWLYPLADANGSFELTNLRVIHGKVAAIRPLFSLDDLRSTIAEFHRHGLLFIWKVGEKVYGHWTGSELPGRLPPEAHRKRYPTGVPVPPKELLTKYLGQLRSNSGVTPDQLRIGLGVGLGFGLGTGLEAETPSQNDNGSQHKGKVSPQWEKLRM